MPPLNPITPLIQATKRLFASQKPQINTTLLQESPIAGFKHHRAPAIWSFIHEGTELRLFREHLNPHDKNAIAIYFKNDMLGYVPKRENTTLAQLMDRGIQVKAQITRLLETDNPWRKVRFQVELMH